MAHPEVVLLDPAHPQLAHADAPRLLWWSESAPAPSRARVVDDRTSADTALGRARAGESLLYRGDWHNARQLLTAMGRRLRPPRPRQPGLAALFEAEREGKRRAQAWLSRLTVPIDPGWSCPLPRAPDLASPLSEAFGEGPARAALLPLREILGAVGAHEWRTRGVPIPSLGGSVYPWYGVFAPVRGEYVELVARAVAERGAPLRRGALAFDIGTGTGVLAILLARAGAQVVATDLEPRAVGCARENAARFGVSERIEVAQCDLFPPGRAALIVANPPWVPAAPHGPLDRAVYDSEGKVLDRLLRELSAHLAPQGEAWLILSDLAERIGLRSPGLVEATARAGGLHLAQVLETRPSHPRARDAADPLATARRAETTRLYVLTLPPGRGGSTPHGDASTRGW